MQRLFTLCVLAGVLEVAYRWPMADLPTLVPSAFLIATAQAAEPNVEEVLAGLGVTNVTQTSDETFPSGTYVVTLLAEYAEFFRVNQLDLYTPGTSEFSNIFSGPEGNFGNTNPQISVQFLRDQPFGLSFVSSPNRFFTQLGNNPDGVVHAKVFKDLSVGGRYYIGFEDILGGGDLDYNDMILQLEQGQGPGTSLSDLTPLEVIPRIYIDEKDTTGIANANRQLVVSLVIKNPGSTPKTFVPCPMLHVHEHTEPTVAGQVLTITSNGGQRVSDTYTHSRTMRFPFPAQTPFTIGANSTATVNYPAKLTAFIPSLENFTRAEIRHKIADHAAQISSTMYISYFTNLRS